MPWWIRKGIRIVPTGLEPPAGVRIRNDNRISILAGSSPDPLNKEIKKRWFPSAHHYRILL